MLRRQPVWYPSTYPWAIEPSDWIEAPPGSWWRSRSTRAEPEPRTPCANLAGPRARWARDPARRARSRRVARGAGCGVSRALRLAPTPGRLRGRRRSCARIWLPRRSGRSGSRWDAPGARSNADRARRDCRQTWSAKCSSSIADRQGYAEAYRSRPHREGAQRRSRGFNGFDSARPCAVRELEHRFRTRQPLQVNVTFTEAFCGRATVLPIRSKNKRAQMKWAPITGACTSASRTCSTTRRRMTVLSTGSPTSTPASTRTATPRSNAPSSATFSSALGCGRRTFAHGSAGGTGHTERAVRALSRPVCVSTRPR